MDCFYKTISDNCSGCGACYYTCPTNSIELKTIKDQAGEIALIKKETCKSCNLCYKVCHQLTECQSFVPQKVYAAWVKDNLDYKTTSSGGIATLISRWIINNNGVVYGAGVVNNTVQHIRIDNQKDLDLLKGSKYVQSSYHIYKNVANDLGNNKNVLVVGTPCQIAAIRKFIPNKLSKNLYLIDLVCHGVPSQNLFKQYLKELFNDSIIKNLDIRFRSKDTLFAELLLLLDKTTGKILYRCKWQKDYFFRAFMMGLIFRENCYSCKYAKPERVGDLSLCDFWGIKQSFSGLKLPHNLSGVLINNEKGRYVFENIADKCYSEERTLEELVKGNANLQSASKKHKDYDVFWKNFEKGNSFISSASKTSLNKEIFIDKILELLKIPYRLLRYSNTGLIDIRNFASKYK